MEPSFYTPTEYKDLERKLHDAQAHIVEQDKIIANLYDMARQLKDTLRR